MIGDKTKVKPGGTSRAMFEKEYPGDKHISVLASEEERKLARWMYHMVSVVDSQESVISSLRDELNDREKHTREFEEMHDRLNSQQMDRAAESASAVDLDSRRWYRNAYVGAMNAYIIGVHVLVSLNIIDGESAKTQVGLVPNACDDIARKAVLAFAKFDEEVGKK